MLSNVAAVLSKEGPLTQLPRRTEITEVPFPFELMFTKEPGRTGEGGIICRYHMTADWEDDQSHKCAMMVYLGLCQKPFDLCLMHYRCI